MMDAEHAAPSERAMALVDALAGAVDADGWNRAHGLHTDNRQRRRVDLLAYLAELEATTRAAVMRRRGGRGMNRRERFVVSALLRTLGHIPMPRHGKGGDAAYSADMRAAMPMVRNALYALLDPDSDVAATVAELEAWVKQREGEGWR